MKTQFNNRMGSRGRLHMNMVVAPVGDGQTLIFEFAGKNIPGVLTVTETRYEKNGKWSHTSWGLELADGIGHFIWAQDWETGRYINAGTWDQAVSDVRALSGITDLCSEAISRFIRARMPNTARALDRAAEAATADPRPVLAELLAAQAELATANAALKAANDEAARLVSEIKQAEEARRAAEQARKDAEETAARVKAAKAAMAKGASLSDLRALLG